MTFQGSQQFFPDARNVVISGGTFTNVKVPDSARDGFKLLLRNISQGAFHDAAERGDPPKCHPHTRKAVRAEIMKWITTPRAMRQLMLWIYGPAGSGKTAIAQTIAEECERQGLLAASFFFWRTAPGRNDTSRFFPTLAYQLSQYMPQIKEHLFKAIEDDPTIFSRSLSTQLRMLVVEPLKLAAPTLPMPPMFALVDGVDECGPDGRSQSELLHLLGSVASEFQHIPLIFLITSRSEHEIREAFNGDLLNPITKVLVLDDNYQPDTDIKLYLDSTFRKIHQEHSRLGRHLPSPWPAVSDVNSLVEKASGQFIFAATVLKYVDSPRHNPADRLTTILRLSNDGNETPFALLDEIYRFILESVVDIDKVLDILALLLLDGPYKFRTLADAEKLLGFEVRSALVDMHSLLSVPPPDENILPRLYHASLSDFLMDRSRSLQFYIGPNHHARLCRYWLKFIGTRTFLTKDAVDSFIHYCRKSPIAKEIGDGLSNLDLRPFLEGISKYREDLYIPKWGEFFVCVGHQGQGRDDILPRLQKDFDTFLLDRIALLPERLRTHFPTILHSLCKPDLQTRTLTELMPPELGLFYGGHSETSGLMLLSSHGSTIWPSFWDNRYIHDLLQDKARAGRYFVDGRSYFALANELVHDIYSSGGWRADFRFADPGHVDKIFDSASTDLGLACFLRNRIRKLEYRYQDYNYLDRASVKYIIRCGLNLSDSAIFVDKPPDSDIVFDKPPGVLRSLLCVECSKILAPFYAAFSTQV